MNRSAPILLALVLFGVGALAQAQPAIYQDGVLHIPQGAMFTNTRQQYFSDIELGADSAGKLSILSATPMPLVYVDSAKVSVTSDTTPAATVTLKVTGNKSVPCVALLDPAVSRDGTSFKVLLAESVQGPGESCIAVLAPFETTLALDVSGLRAGSYQVVVNAEAAASFELHTDQP